MSKWYLNLVKRKALVAGGAGFIGSHLCKKLFEKNYDVIAYDDLSNGSGKKNLPNKIKFVNGSILNPKKLKEVCKNVDVVFNLAVKPLSMSFDKPDIVVKVNDIGAYYVAKICTELKHKLIHVSSSEAYGSAMLIPMHENHPLLPSTIYAASKAASEMYVRGLHKTDGLKMVIVRPFNCYGPFMREDVYGAAIPKFFKRIATKKSPIIFGNGNQTRDLTFIDDTVNGIVLADNEPTAIGETFNIAQGKETSVRKMAEVLMDEYEKITGKKVMKNLIFKKERKGDVMRHLADISHARKILNYEPKISLRHGISQYIKWKLKNINSG